jgi:LCP family protein required for cell wall assembly
VTTSDPTTSQAAKDDPVIETPTARRGRVARIIAGLAALAVIATALVGAGMEFLYGRLQGNITSLDISDVLGRGPNTAVTDADGNYQPLTILLMGSDSREGVPDSRYGDPSIHSNARSDTTIVVHVGADRSFATAVSIPRDTWVTLPECPRPESGEMGGGFEAKFNTAFEIGGPGCTMKLVEQMTGLEIDHFAVIDFMGFTSIVDALGGVEVCLTESVNDPDSKLVLPAGTTVVDGEQALAFVRARKTLSDGSDLSRIKRQQTFLSSMVREATAAQLFFNPVRLYSVLDAATSSLTTDQGLADRDVLQQTALSLRSVQPGDITFLTMPWVERGDGSNVVMDADRAARVWQSIADDVPWKKPRRANRDTAEADTLTVAPADISLTVLNGSGVAGRAGQTAQVLGSAGFVIVNVADADRPDYSQTEVRYAPGSLEAARTVAAALPGAKLVEDSGVTSVTIVLGRDFTEVVDVTIAPPAPPITDEDLEGVLDDNITDSRTADTVRCD